MRICKDSNGEGDTGSDDSILKLCCGFISHDEQPSIGRHSFDIFRVSGVSQDVKSDLKLSVVQVSMLASSSFPVADISHAYWESYCDS